MKIRDLLAVPFWALALGLEWLAVKIGGTWTAQMFYEQAMKLPEELDKNKK